MDKDDMSLRVASFSCYLDTAKENLVHRVSSQDQTPIPLTSSKTSIKPPFSIKFSKSSQDSLTNLRVDSFSYLNTTTGDNNFVFEIPGPIQDPTSAFTFSQEIPKDSEIGVFGADKYFNMKLEYHHHQKTAETKHKFNNEVAPQKIESNINRTIRTPSLSSEASSWNSQTALIPDNFQKIGYSQTKQKKTIGRRNIFTGFGCRGPCFDKKSVHIDKIVYTGSKLPTRTGSERIDHLALIPVPENHSTAKNQLKMESLDESRHSIEVFGSNTSKGDNIATNMERKLSMLTWDAIPKSQTPLPASKSSTVCDDMASDASSDLFEIENISGSIFPSITSEPADDVSTCMSPTSHYAPSEASIQWSVVTASAADYNSILSDYNDLNERERCRNNNMTNRSSKTRNDCKEVQKSRSGGLLGCKSHKAVDVAENVCHKINDQKTAKHHQGLDLSVSSFGKSGRVKDVDVLKLPRSFANGGLNSHPSVP
ncbi:hypothetical protein DH2020_013040 [Rehmannia glutinosa]|uniref:Uncharacterized protein n=1 Tax=Rehmannia glutinosa TaxID=99300 RepID=A0ABR0X2I4_REHGL